MSEGYSSERHSVSQLLHPLSSHWVLNWTIICLFQSSISSVLGSCDLVSQVWGTSRGTTGMGRRDASTLLKICSQSPAAFWTWPVVLCDTSSSRWEQQQKEVGGQRSRQNSTLIRLWWGILLIHPGPSVPQISAFMHYKNSSNTDNNS